MRKNTFQFNGRGNMGGDLIEPYRMIECAEGPVLAVLYTCHGVEFIHCYCRKALFDQWGLHCSKPFYRTSEPGCRRSWAESMGKDLFLFYATRLDIVPEEDWMTNVC